MIRGLVIRVLRKFKQIGIAIGLLLCIGLISKSIAQVIDIELRHYSTEKGLEFPMVNDLFSSKDGYLWLSTLGGIVRFDGTNFDNFEPPGLESKSINFLCVAEDENGVIYAIGEDLWGKRKLYSLQNEKGILSAIEKNNNFPINSKAFLPANEGEFFIVTLEEELYHFANGKAKWLFKSPNQIPIINVKNSHDNILVQNADHEVFRVDWETKSTRLSPDEIPTIEPVLLDEADNIHNIIFEDLNEFPWFSAQPSLLDSPVYPFPSGTYFIFHQDSGDFTWVVKNKSIIFKDGVSGNWKDFSYLLEDFPKAQGIKCAFLDPFDQLWIGTNDGIFALKPNFSIAKTLFTGKDHLGNAYSFRGITAWKGEIFANSYSGKMKYLPQIEEEALFQPLKVNNHLLAAFSKDDEYLWMADGQELLKFSDIQKAPIKYPLPYQEPYPYNSLEIWSIFEDKFGVVWLGTNAGLAVLDSLEGNVRFIPDQGNHEKEVAKINHIHPIQNGIILATSLGIKFYNYDNGFQPVERNQALFEKLTEGIPIYHIYMDDDGNIWLASHGEGLIHWNPDSSVLNRFGVSSGFTNLHLHAVYEDHKGGLWIPSENGLFLFDTQDQRAMRFGKKNGLSDEEFNRISHFQDKEGTMYFGGVAGINVIDPSKTYSLLENPVKQLYWFAAHLLHNNGKHIEDIALAIKAGKTIPVSSTTTSLSIHLLNLRDFKTFEYKWNSKDTTWQISNASLISIDEIPAHSDEFLIRAVDHSGQITGHLTLPVNFDSPKGYTDVIFFLFGISFLGITGFILYRKKSNSLKIPGISHDGVSVDKGNSNREKVDAFVEKLEEVVWENISLPEFGVEQLSEALCLSRKSLYRKTNQHLDKNPKEYIKELRLDYAKKLLSSSDLNIAEITFKAGFGSSSYFSNCYKKHFGVTPKEYRKQLLNSN